MKRAFPLIVGLAAMLALVTAGCGGVVDSQAEAKLKADLGKATIAVYPAFLRNGSAGGAYDDASAVLAAELLTQHALGVPTIREEHIPLSGAAGSNQLALYKETLKQFAAHVRANPPGTQHALMPEFLLDRNGKALGVHLHVVDAEGRCAYALLFNSHHEPFNKANLDTPAGCTKLAIDTMALDLKGKR